MASKFLDESVMAAFDVDAFLATRPFPWHTLDGLLTDVGFEALRNDYPPLELFDWHAGRRGRRYVKPQDRYFLEYDSTAQAAPGNAGPDDLPAAWRQFIDELETSAPYRALIEQIIDSPIQLVRYTWHMGVTGSEVCPHIDTDTKMATNIFYFNTVDDWDPAWGGNTIILDGKKPGVEYPDFGDFDAGETLEYLGNRSLLFRNTADAWHGVRPLTCPEGSYRRIFNVVFEHLDRRLDLDQRVAAQRRTGLRQRFATMLGR
jgi:hypothetical protein